MLLWGENKLDRQFYNFQFSIPTTFPIPLERVQIQNIFALSLIMKHGNKTNVPKPERLRKKTFSLVPFLTVARWKIISTESWIFHLRRRQRWMDGPWSRWKKILILKDYLSLWRLMMMLLGYMDLETRNHPPYIVDVSSIWNKIHVLSSRLNLKLCKHWNQHRSYIEDMEKLWRSCNVTIFQRGFTYHRVFTINLLLLRIK